MTMAAFENKNNNNEFIADEFYNELKSFGEDAWFLPIDPNASLSDVTSSTPQPNTCNKYSRLSLSPCTDSNQSFISGGSCMYEDRRSVTPASSLSSVLGSGGLAAEAIPSNIPYQGQHGFQIGFESQQQDTKSISWTYSQPLRKLFVRMATSCPVKFRTAFQPPEGSIIRATPIYIKPEHVQEVVHRCPNHAAGREHNDHLTAPASHLLRCDSVTAEYCTDTQTGRHSVTVPCEQPQAGSEWVTNLYQFMCFSSCVGGLNRRPLQVIFTLEYDGQILGRQSVEVRICACPGRDRKVEENAMFPAPKPVKRPQGHNKNMPPAKRIKVNGVDTEEFTLTIKGKENFELLCKLRDSLELAMFLPKEKLQTMFQ